MIARSVVSGGSATTFSSGTKLDSSTFTSSTDSTCTTSYSDSFITFGTVAFFYYLWITFCIAFNRGDLVSFGDLFLVALATGFAYCFTAVFASVDAFLVYFRVGDFVLFYFVYCLIASLRFVHKHLLMSASTCS